MMMMMRITMIIIKAATTPTVAIITSKLPSLLSSVTGGIVVTNELETWWCL